MVYLNKHAHWGDPALTDKTGGCNNKAGAVEIMHVDWPGREPGRVESNGWCRPHSKTNQLVGMRKGSVRVRGVAPKGRHAVRVVGGHVVKRGHWS